MKRVCFWIEATFEIHSKNNRVSIKTYQYLNDADFP